MQRGLSVAIACALIGCGENDAVAPPLSPGGADATTTSDVGAADAASSDARGSETTFDERDASLVARDGGWVATAPTSPTRPSPRYGASFAWDEKRQRGVLFGGQYDLIFCPPAQYCSDTWTWDGAGWTKHTPATSPPGRRHAGMAYDAVRERVVLFGGQDDATMQDTWEWDGTNWLERTPVTAPPKRQGAILVFDPLRARMVLFGGGEPDGASVLGDLWEWDGTSWTERTQSTVRPSARQGYAMAWYGPRAEIVLYGGSTGGAHVRDTWVLAPATGAWTEQKVPVPGAGFAATLTEDPMRSQLVLFGGFLDGVTVDETWTWDGATWTKGEGGPTSRYFHVSTWDPVRRRVLIGFGVSTATPHAASTYLDDLWAR